MSKEQDLWKELGLEDESSKENKGIELIDPATGKPITFNSVEEANAAIKKMYEQNLSELNKLRQTPVETSKPEKKAKKVEAEEDDKPVLSVEEQAAFRALSEKDPFKGIDYYLQRSPVVKELKKQLKEAEAKNEALVNSIQVNSFVTSTPALNPQVNPKAAEVQTVTGKILEAMGVEKNPNQVQLLAATAFARNQRPDLFEFEQQQNEQNQGQQLQHQQNGAGYGQASVNQTKPNNFPVPPRAGSNNYGAPQPVNLLESAWKKGGSEKMKEGLDALINQHGIDAFFKQ